MAEITLGQLLDSTGGSIQTGPFGTKLKAEEYVVGEGTPVVSVGEVGHGAVRIGERTPRVGRDTVDRLPMYVLHAGDIVFARKGAVDRSAWVRAAESGYFLGSDGIRVRLGEGTSSRFVAFQLRLGRLRSWLLQNAAGTTMASLNEPTLARLPLWIPQYSDQQGIAGVLGALDDKIAANEQVSTAADRLRTEVASVEARRDGSLRSLSSLARFVNGRAFTKGASGTGRVVVRIAELNSGIGGSTVYSDLEVADDHLARAGDLLFAWSGSLTVARWYRDEAIVNQHIFKVIPSLGCSSWLIDYALRAKLTEFQGVAADKATTMGHIQRRHLDEQVMIPAPEAVVRLHQPMDALWQQALSAEIENERLAAVRDELLPLLMSGRLRVKAAEKIVEEVV